MTWPLDARTVRQPVLLIVASILLLLLLHQLAVRGLLLALTPLLIAVVAALVLLRFPWSGFALLLGSVPFQRFGSEGTALPATFTQIVFPVAIAGTLLVLFAERRPARGHVFLLPYTLLVAVMILSSIQAESMGAAWAEIARWFVALAAFWMALQLVVQGSDRRLVGFVALLAAAGVFEATIGVVQSVIGFGPFQVGTGVSRAFGTFGRPNSYAGFLEMTFFPASALTLWFGRESYRRFREYQRERLRGMVESRDARRHLLRSVLALVVFAGASGLILSGIVASLSRGALLGIAAGGIATALLLGPITRLLVALAGVIAVALLVGGLAGILPESYRDRLADSIDQIRPVNVRSVPVTDENFATVERLAHWQTGLGMYRDHPVLGVGVGNYNTRFEEYSVRPGFRTSQGHAHNYYIHTLAETGLVGLLVYLSLLGSIIVLALRTLLARDYRHTLGRMMVLGAFGSIIAVATHNLVENLHVLNLGIVISLLWAIVIAGHERWRTQQFAAA